MAVQSPHENTDGKMNNQQQNNMRVIVNDKGVKHCFRVTKVSVHSNLTFCEIERSPALFPILMHLVKNNIIHSFEPKNDVTSITFRTQYVEEII